MKYSIIKFIKALYHLGDKFYPNEFGAFGLDVCLPRNLSISNPSNIYIADHIHIGENATLFATNAKIIIKRYFVSADGLKIATGQHERRVGRFLGSITEQDKNHNIRLDEDVIINEDVWCGFNVCIMSGVEIGRGCTIAAGAVVTRSLPPYCIAAGVPARPIKFYWTVEQILEHEKALYKKEERLSEGYLRQVVVDSII